MIQRLTLLTLLVMFAFLISLMAGKVWIAPGDWFAADPGGWIIAELRLPRALLALIIGAGLGMAGAVLQGYVRNPLADPALVGVSSSAALGAVLAIYFGLSMTPGAVFIAAMIGAAGAVILLSILTGRSGGSTAFILAGMVLSSLAGALTAFVISIAPNPFASAEIVTWLMGALTDRGWDQLVMAAPAILVGMIVLAFTARSLDLLTLGEATAQTLGLEPRRLQAQVAIGMGLIVGASVAVSGVVGFVGLIVPHLVRPLFGSRPSAILFPSALAGAALLTTADALVRLVPGPGELRLGVAMAMLGTPFFLIVLTRMRKGVAWG